MSVNESPFYTATSKQVLRGGQSFADAATEQAAQEIADMMNLPAWLEERAERSTKARGVGRIYRVLASNLRAGLHGSTGL